MASTSGPGLSPLAPGEFRYDAFISYSHKDREWVHGTLLPYLERNGLRVCIDERDFDVGAPRLENMENAVERSQKTLLVLTPHWVSSEWTHFEALLAQTKDPAGRHRRTLPLLLEACTLPARLQAFTHLDLTQPAQRDAQLRRLIEAIRSVSGAEPPAIAPAIHTPASALPPNPFTATLAVRDAMGFVGRDAELRMLKTMLAGGSVALIGQPKIGKSSLLWQLKIGWTGKTIGPLDCMLLDGRDDLYTILANELGLGNAADWRAIRQALYHTEALLLIDELDAGPTCGLGYEDVTRFRAVCDANRAFRLMVVARRPLKHVFADTGKGSPAYNFLQPLTLDVLNEADALRVLAHPWAPATPAFDSTACSQLLALAGRHPFRLQRAAFHRYEALTNPAYDWQAAYRQDLEHML